MKLKMLNSFRQTLEEVKRSIMKVLQTTKTGYQLAPLVSGGVALFLFDKIVFSNLEGVKFKWSIIIVSLMLIASGTLYYFLRRLEKEKDVYLLSVVGRTVGDVFKKYGQQMAVKNAECAKAEDMNKIMQTIVNLVKNMKNLGNKKYVSK